MTNSATEGFWKCTPELLEPSRWDDSALLQMQLLWLLSGLGDILWHRVVVIPIQKIHAAAGGGYRCADVTVNNTSRNRLSTVVVLGDGGVRLREYHVEVAAGGVVKFLNNKSVTCKKATTKHIPFGMSRQ